MPQSPPDPQRPIVLAGHQPQMFHPGVWFKSFALGRLAEQCGATAVHLLIDGDAISETSLQVPGGSAAEPVVRPIPFDRRAPNIPWEERKIEDRELFNSFGARAIEQIKPLVPDPLIERYWPLVLERARHTENLGACLAAARHRLEETFSAPPTLEVPLGRLCRGEAFQWFVAHLLAQLPRFRLVYNDALQEYRRAYRVRGVSHPAPDLAEAGTWLESPFWIWTAGDPRRRRLFAQAACDEIVLSDRQDWQTRLPLAAEGDAARAVAQLMEIQLGGGESVPVP